MRSRHLLIRRLLERSRLCVLKLLKWLLLKLWLLWDQLCVWNQLPRCGGSKLSRVLRTNWLTGILLPDGVRSSNRLLRLHCVTGGCVLW